MTIDKTETGIDRREQILRAAMVCFAKRGFHQATMQDLAEQAGISVGLIYRYFENKDAVISAMADQHKTEIQQVLERARQAPTLLEALETLFTAHCCESAPQVEAAFVVDLFAEASRNPRVAELVRDVSKTVTDAVTELIASAPESKRAARDLTPRQITELIFAVSDGMLMREVLNISPASDDQRRERQLKLARTFWRLVFETDGTAVTDNRGSKSPRQAAAIGS